MATPSTFQQNRAKVLGIDPNQTKPSGGNDFQKYRSSVLEYSRLQSEQNANKIPPISTPINQP